MPDADPRSARSRRRRRGLVAALAAGVTLLTGCSSDGAATTSGSHGGEVNLVLPDLSIVEVAGGFSGRALLTIGIIVCLFGLGFGYLAYAELRRMAVHPSMAEVADLIYTTCKAYLTKQGRFILLLWLFI